MGLWINYRCYAIWCYNMPCARSFTQNLRPARVLCPKLFRDDRRDLTFFGDHYSTLWPSTMLRCYNVTSLSLNPWVYMSTGSTVYSDEPPEDGDFVARKWWNPRKDMLKIGDFWWITVFLHQNSSNFPVLGQLHSKLLRGLWRNPAFSQPSCSQPPDTTSQISDGFLCRIVLIGRILPVILGSILWSDDQSSSSSMDIMDSHVQVSCHSEVVLIPIVLGSKIYNHQPSFINDGQSAVITHRIHGAAIYGNMDPINIPPMLAYMP